jgi:rhodanese-related sulfurtransferase
MAAPAPIIVDVRQASERTLKHIAGSLHIPLGRLMDQVKELPATEPLVHCAGGYRSSIAASLLQRSDGTWVGEIASGIGAWESAGLAVALAGADVVECGRTPRLEAKRNPTVGIAECPDRCSTIFGRSDAGSYSSSASSAPAFCRFSRLMISANNSQPPCAPAVAS